MRMPSGLAAIIFAALLPAAACADGLVDNVNGITLDENGKAIRFEGLLISPDGKVTQLLTRKDKPPKQLDFRYDGKGKTMLPGMVDAHGDVMDLGFAALTLDLSATNSLAEAQAAIAAYASKHPDRSWIVGRGWDQQKWGLGRFPNAADLQTAQLKLAAGGRPIWLTDASGGAGWANAAAMDAAQIKVGTLTPKGGRIEILAGAPSGIFVGSAAQLITKYITAPRPVERDVALAKAQAILLAHGITSITDMGTTIEDWQSYRRAGDAGWLSIRIFGYADGIDNMVAIAGPRPSPWLYDDKLRLGGVEFKLDGTLASRGAWLKAPYADARGQQGLPLLENAEIRNLMVRASMDGFQTAVRTQGDAAVGEAVDAISELSDTFTGDRRWRIENAQVIDPLDRVRLGKYGVIASVQPVQLISGRAVAENRLGLERLANAFSWKSLAGAGGKLAFGSATPAKLDNPFTGIAAAITREDENGQPFGGWQPEERLSREQALAGYTISSAYAAFAADKVGSLTPGHRADFILVSTDPLLANPREIRDTVVDETWLAGRPVYKRGEMVEAAGANADAAQGR
jgi:predicted amidohydrolase YtcJ